MPTAPIITLLTDFGEGSPYVAAMKGVILSINPEVRLVDLSHSIPAQQVRQAAIALADVAPLFPAGTLHLAVVDPGVGTSRAIVYVEIAGQRFVCPDNGILHALAKDVTPSKIIHITAEQFFRQPVAPTFHGRDIMAPTAAHLSLGVPPEELGPTLESIQQLDWSGVVKVANRIEGEVITVDSFGNLITNISRDQLEGVPTDIQVGIFCEDHETRGIFSTYADQPPMTLIALVSSSDQLELAIVDENAAAMLGAGAGAKVEVRW